MKPLQIPTTETVDPRLVRLCLDLAAVEAVHGNIVERVQQALAEAPEGWQRRAALIVQHGSRIMQPVVLIAATADEAARMQARVRPVSDPLADASTEVDTAYQAHQQGDVGLRFEQVAGDPQIYTSDVHRADDALKTDHVDRVCVAFTGELFARLEGVRAMAALHLTRCATMVESGFGHEPPGMRKIEALVSLLDRWGEEMKRLGKDGAEALLPAEVGPLQVTIDRLTRERDQAIRDRNDCDKAAQEMQEKLEEAHKLNVNLESEACERHARHDRETSTLRRELAAQVGRVQRVGGGGTTVKMAAEQLLVASVDDNVDPEQVLAAIESPYPSERRAPVIAWSEVAPGSVVVGPGGVFMRYPDDNDLGLDGVLLRGFVSDPKPLWPWSAGAPGVDQTHPVKVLFTGLSEETCRKIGGDTLVYLGTLLADMQVDSDRAIYDRLVNARKVLLEMLVADDDAALFDDLLDRVKTMLRLAQDKAGTTAKDTDQIVRGFAVAAGIAVAPTLEGAPLINAVIGAYKAVRARVDGLAGQLGEVCEVAGSKLENLVTRVRELVAVVATLHGWDPSTLINGAYASRVGSGTGVLRYASEAREAWATTSNAELHCGDMSTTLAEIAKCVHLHTEAATVVRADVQQVDLGSALERIRGAVRSLAAIDDAAVRVFADATERGESLTYEQLVEYKKSDDPSTR